jgi:hypothetical protein
MNELIKEIKRQLKFAEKKYNTINEYIINNNNIEINDTIDRLYWHSQMNAYNSILQYIKQEELS